METHTTPIKRSTQLSGLSREHHEGLLFVWKIKQGIALGISEKRIGDYCAWFWKNHLQTHMQLEETVLPKVMASTNPLMNTMIEDHAAIKAKIEEVIVEPNYQSLKRLVQIIYYHIRFEERTLFPAIEHAATREQLDQVAVQLSHPAPENTWPDEFWLKARNKKPTAAKK